MTKPEIASVPKSKNKYKSWRRSATVAGLAAGTALGALAPMAISAPPKKPKKTIICLEEGAPLIKGRDNIAQLIRNGVTNAGVVEERQTATAIERGNPRTQTHFQIVAPTQPKSIQKLWTTTAVFNGQSGLVTRGRCRPQDDFEATKPDRGRLGDDGEILDSLTDRDNYINFNDQLGLYATGRLGRGDSACEMTGGRVSIHEDVAKYVTRVTVNFIGRGFAPISYLGLNEDPNLGRNPISQGTKVGKSYVLGFQPMKLGTCSDVALEAEFYISVPGAGDSSMRLAYEDTQEDIAKRRITLGSGSGGSPTVSPFPTQPTPPTTDPGDTPPIPG